LETENKLQTPEALESRIQVLLDRQLFDDTESNLIRLRYGIGIEQPLPPSEIARVMKIKAKALEALVDQVDRKIFNHLKNEL
jgi:DNA-directed RNA polymerase sigma subunit (sigma70/sigma32)